tara:strand:- start:1169 stop:1408 length:240 start_codon:yes stop_codon:yes gene_type:complete
MTERLRIHLNDEATRIGSGHRIVDVLTRGPKWITVEYAPKTIRQKGQALDGHTRQPIKVTRHKFPVAVWAQIERKAVAV